MEFEVHFEVHLHFQNPTKLLVSLWIILHVDGDICPRRSYLLQLTLLSEKEQQSGPELANIELKRLTSNVSMEMLSKHLPCKKCWGNRMVEVITL